MFTPFILFLGLTVATAFIAHWSDNLGKKLGKKRVSLFGLRPRTTATILTVVSSWAIMGFTIAVLLIVVRPLRNALFRYDAERAEYRRDIAIAKNDISATERRLNAAQGRLTTTQTSLSSVSSELQQANTNIQKVRSDARKAEAEGKKRVALANLQAKRASVQATTAQNRTREAQRRENEARQGEREAEQLKRGAELALQGSKQSLSQVQGKFAETQSRLSQARNRLANTNLRLKDIEAKLKISSQSLYRAGKEAFRVGGQLLVLERNVLALQRQQYALLQQRDELSEEVTRLEAGDVRIPVGRVFASRIISAGQKPEGIESALREIFNQGQIALQESDDTESLFERGFRLQLLTVGNQGEEVVLLGVAQFYKRLAREIADQGEATSIRLVAFRNFTPILKRDEKPENNPILVRFVVVPVAIAFRSGETIASAVIDGSLGDALIFRKLLDLTEEGRVAAVQRRVDPPQSPYEPNFYATGDTNVSLFEALRRIEASKRQVRVNLVAAKDLSTVEPLRVRFEIEDIAENS